MTSYYEVVRSMTDDRTLLDAVDQAEQSRDCWLCDGLGGIAVHEQWSARRGKPLWTAHEYPSDDPHPTRPCPVCSARRAGPPISAWSPQPWEQFTDNREE